LFEREQKLLDTMTEIAETSRALPDARVKKLIEWIRDNMCPDLPAAGATWNDTRVIVFTEWEDTRRYLQQQINAVISDTDRASERMAVYCGSTPARRTEGEESRALDRESIKTAFNTDPARHPLRILIATDAAREGLNLQAHCWNLFHFDVPWNPSRMEQRNGRIDRKLQPNPEVYCYYFFYKQRPEDRILAALAAAKISFCRTHFCSSHIPTGPANYPAPGSPSSLLHEFFRWTHFCSVLFAGTQRISGGGSFSPCGPSFPHSFRSTTSTGAPSRMVRRPRGHIAFAMDPLLYSPFD
jgi:hypothetical protein